MTLGGKAEFNIANALAAILAAYTNKIKLSTIRQALKTFIPSAETTPGRINLFEFNDFDVLLDYAHNPHGLKALGKLVRNMEAESRIGVITAVGDRRDEDIIAVGEAAAEIFDEIIIRHDEDMRGRRVEEVEKLLTRGIVKVNDKIPITYSLAECEAVEYAIENAKTDSLIVVLSDNIRKVTDCILQYQQREKERSQLQRAG
jgi:cyanophycin synthetase